MNSEILLGRCQVLQLQNILTSPNFVPTEWYLSPSVLPAFLTPPLGRTSFSITLLGRVCRVRIWECTLLDSQGDYPACPFPLWSWRPYVILHLNYFNILDSVGIVFASTRIFQRLISSFGKSHIHNPFWDRPLYLISGNLYIFTCVYNKAFNLSKVISVQKNGLLGTI